MRYLGRCSIRGCESDEAWVVYDARGIPVGRACSPEHEDELAGRYRPEVMTDPNYYADEPIEPEEEVGGWAEDW